MERDLLGVNEKLQQMKIWFDASTEEEIMDRLQANAAVGQPECEQWLAILSLALHSFEQLETVVNNA